MTRQRPGRRRLAATLRNALPLLALLCLAPVGTRAAGVLYAGPATDPVFTVIAPHLLTALFPEQRLDAAAAAGGTAALDQVVADPTSIALADLATMLDYMAAKKLAAERLEFHGPISAHCVLAFVRRDGWVRAFSDIATANGAPRPVIGVAGPDATNLLGMIRRIEPGLATVETQLGSADELAAQVARGAPDILLLVAQPDLDRALLERIADDDRLTLLPVVTRLLARAAVDRNSGFAMQGVYTDSGLTPWSRRPVNTLCTPVGVVLRGDAPPALRDAVNRAAPLVAASLRPSLGDRAGAAASSTLHDTVDTLHGLLNRLRSN